MLKKLVFIFSFVLAQTADKLLDLFWLYYIFNKTNSISSVAILALVLVVFRAFIFIVIRSIFHKSSFYGHYILAYSFAFLIILLINKISIDIIIFLLMAIKEIYSAFRITGTKAYFNQLNSKRKQVLIIINTLGYLIYPLAIVLLKFFLDRQISDQVFTAFALLVAPAMILTFKLNSKSHKFVAQQDLRIKLTESNEHSSFKKILQFLVIMIWPLVQIAFYLNVVVALKNNFRLEWDWPLAVLISTVALAVVLNVIDRFEKTSQRYAEYSGKIGESIIFILTAIIFFILA